MSRPRSDDRRNAILSAATRAIASQGLGAATATIAQEAGVSNGSLFTYFATKADLLNYLYRALKTEMITAACDGLPTASDIRTQMRHMWSQWLRWATSCPEKRRTLAQLDVSDDITAQSHHAASHTLAGVRELLDRSREHGPLRDAPPEFVVALMSGLADATIDFMIQDPANADKHSMVAFDAFWRIFV